MTPSITENTIGSQHGSVNDSKSSFSLSDDDIEHPPKFLEDSKMKKISTMKEGSKTPYEKTNSMREVRAQLKNSLETRKQIFNSVTQKKMIRESLYDKDKSLHRNQSSKMSRKGSTISRNSVSKVEYRYFKKHEFFEERVKKQREKVRFMIEEDPESDRKVTFKNNQGFIKV